MLDKISCYCHSRDAEKYSDDEIQVYRLVDRFQQTESVKDHF